MTPPCRRKMWMLQPTMCHVVYCGQGLEVPLQQTAMSYFRNKNKGFNTDEITISVRLSHIMECNMQFMFCNLHFSWQNNCFQNGNTTYLTIVISPHFSLSLSWFRPLVCSHSDIITKQRILGHFMIPCTTNSKKAKYLPTKANGM